MKVCITTPNRKAPNGGIRLINDLFDELSLRHNVYLLDESALYNTDRIITHTTFKQTHFDLVICCSPHSAWVLGMNKTVVWAQMAEHLFREEDKLFDAKCRLWYKHDNIVCNSKWLKVFMPQANVCRTWLPSYFVEAKPQERTFDLLLESPVSNNPSKDVNGFALKVARHLKQKYPSIRIVGYGAKKCADPIFNNFFVSPINNTLTTLYSTSKLLLKATVHDGAACAPIEAMRFGCLTVRALENGDDYMTNELGWRTKYNLDDFIQAAEIALLEARQPEGFNDYENRLRACKAFINTWTFDNFITEFNELAGTRL
jgi:hypothetical protein